MSTAAPDVTEEITIDIPNDRQYDSQEDADLDAVLVEAIKKAQDAENTYLETVLRNELKSHYYDSQI